MEWELLQSNPMFAALLTLIFGLAQNAPAQEVRHIHSEPGFEVFTLDPTLGAEAAGAPLRALKRAISKFPNLPWPETIQIGLTREGENFKSLGDVIFGEVEYVTVGRTGRPARLTGKALEAFWIHELGHTLISRYLKKKWIETLPEIREALLNSSMREMRDPILADLERPGFDAFTGFGAGRMAEPLFRIFKRDPSIMVNQDNYDLVDIGLKTSKYQRELWDATHVLQEFFGDVLAAAVTGSPTRMSDAIESVSGFENGRYRSLQRQVPLKGFFNLKEALHTVMAPARLKAGELLAHNGNSEEVVQAAAEAVLDVVGDLWKNPVRAADIMETLNELAVSENKSSRTDLKEFNNVNAKFARLNRELRARLSVRASRIGPKSCRALLGG
ncbi:MAG: hypothetical protein ABL958_06030 [Bdellovibrionia bacterium]